MVEVNDAGTGSIDDLVNEARLEAEKEAADSPPSSKRKRTVKRTTGRKRDLSGPLTELYSTLGAGVCILNQADGILILENAENCANSLNDLAKTNDAVYRALDKLCTGGAMGAVMMAHAPILLGIMGNHDLVPTLFGGKAKDADEDKADQKIPTGPRTNGNSGTPQGASGPASTVGRSGTLSPAIVGAG